MADRDPAVEGQAAGPGVDPLELYKHCRDFESNFNGMQDSIRKIASGWMLAAFTAIGVLLTQSVEPKDVTHLPLAAAGLIQIVCLLAGVGIFVLWILDQKVYQNLLRSAYLAAMKIETEHPDFPKIRQGMWLSSSKVGMGKWISTFYLVPLFVFALCSLASLASWLGVAFLAVSVALPLVVLCWSAGAADYAALAGTVGGEAFARRFREFTQQADD